MKSVLLHVFVGSNSKILKDFGDGFIIRRMRLEDIVGHGGPKQLIMLMAMDQRVMYSDGLDVNINQAGITLNFTQAAGNNRRTSVES